MHNCSACLWGIREPGRIKRRRMKDEGSRGARCIAARTIALSGLSCNVTYLRGVGRSFPNPVPPKKIHLPGYRPPAWLNGPATRAGRSAGAPRNRALRRSAQSPRTGPSRYSRCRNISAPVPSRKASQARSEIEMPPQRAEVHVLARAPFDILEVEPGAERVRAACQHHDRGCGVILKTARGRGELA
jgi:hypothetical protein